MAQDAFNEGARDGERVLRIKRALETLDRALMRENWARSRTHLLKTSKALIDDAAAIYVGRTFSSSLAAAGRYDQTGYPVEISWDEGDKSLLIDICDDEQSAGQLANDLAWLNENLRVLNDEPFVAIKPKCLHQVLRTINHGRSSVLVTYAHSFRGIEIDFADTDQELEHFVRMMDACDWQRKGSHKLPRPQPVCEERTGTIRFPSP